jgi:hypothetical protein
MKLGVQLCAEQQGGRIFHPPIALSVQRAAGYLELRGKCYPLDRSEGRSLRVTSHSFRIGPVVESALQRLQKRHQIGFLLGR